jgi:hypothetical protein
MRTAARRTLIVLGIVAVVAVAARLAAPFAVERYVNRALSDMGEYTGRVSDIELSLIRGGYVLHNLEIVKRDAAADTPPFASIPAMDLSLQWRALFKGRAVGEALLHGPQLNLVQSEANEEKQLGAGVNWPQEVRDLFPFQLNKLEARDGLVTFSAPGISTNDSLTMRGFQMQLLNLTNVQDLEEPAFADIDVRGQIMGNAPITLVGGIDPNEQTPTFDVDLTIEGARLVDVNPWLREFLKVDAESGVFSMYSELAAAEGRFEGYVRPILEDPKFLSSDDEGEGPFRKVWEGLVNLAAKILENKQEDQVATQIPLRGEIEDPQAGVVTAMVNLVRNAFVAAFSHSLEGSINLRDVATDVQCLAGEPAAAEQPDQEPSRRERRRDRC